MPFWKKKLKRVHPDKVKNGKTDSVSRNRTITHVLFCILFALMLLGILGPSHMVDIPSTLSTLTVIFLMVVFWSAYLFAFHYKEVLGSYLRIFLFGILTVAPFILLEVFIRLNWSLLFLPITLISMMIALGYSRRIAVANLLFQSFLVWFLIEPFYQTFFFIHLPGSIIAALGIANIRTRANLIKLGALAGASHFIIIVAYALLNNAHLSQNELVNQGLLGLANGIVSGFVVLGILPFLERWFQILTDQSLLELTDLNHPLLKELSLKAPGTYHHSLRVGNLAEAATDAINANGLLSRVGSYYHDIGKLNKPEYFIENEAASLDKHKALTPSMSTLVITAHAKDGIELAQYHKLPPIIIDFVIQHHGTSVVKYFYHAALQNNDSEANHKNKTKKNGIDEESFRYPGPNPRSKQSGVVLLADSIEAASRTLDDITPAKLEGLVHEVIMEKLLDGQLDECNLTMKEFKVVEATFIRVLAGIFHPRIKYPEKPAKEKT